MRIIKRFILLALVFALMFCAAICFIKSRQEKMIDSLGKPEIQKMWTSGGFQDYTDFGIFYYPNLNIEKSKDFSRLSPEDIETLCSFLDHYEGFIRAIQRNDPEDELVLNYAFDRRIIDSDDYFYIRLEDKDHPYYNYDVWFFDSQSKTLFYFHNNI